MISLPYLRENTAEIRENKQKLASKKVHAADFRSTVMPILPPAQESVPDNVKVGRNVRNTAPPIRIQYS